MFGICMGAVLFVVFILVLAVLTGRAIHMGMGPDDWPDRDPRTPRE